MSREMTNSCGLFLCFFRVWKRLILSDETFFMSFRRRLPVTNRPSRLYWKIEAIASRRPTLANRCASEAPSGCSSVTARGRHDRLDLWLDDLPLGGAAFRRRSFPALGSAAQRGGSEIARFFSHLFISTLC